MPSYWDRFPEREARMYLLEHGLVYTAKYATPFLTERTPAVLLLSLSDQAITVETSEGITKGHALLIAPNTKRKMKVWDVPFVGFHIGPSHSCYSGLQTVFKDRPVRKIPVSTLIDVQDNMSQSLGHDYSVEAVEDVFCDLIEKLKHHLEIECTQDSRISDIILHLSAISPLDYEFQELLVKSGLSQSRLSHLFTEQVGISLRTFKSWQKTTEALFLLQGGDSLTSIAHESGFSDSAHFSRTFSRTFGLIPSMFRDGRCVQVIGKVVH